MAEMRTNVSVAPALGEIPSVQFNVDGTMNICVTVTTERGDEVALWFDDDAHLLQWLRMVLLAARRRTEPNLPSMMVGHVDDERPPAPVDAAQYTFGAGRG